MPAHPNGLGHRPYGAVGGGSLLSEVGARYDGGSFTGQLALFRLDVSHERIQDPVTREVLQTGKSVRQGINFDGQLRVGSRLTIRADGTRLATAG